MLCCPPPRWRPFSELFPLLHKSANIIEAELSVADAVRLLEYIHRIEGNSISVWGVTVSRLLSQWLLPFLVILTQIYMYTYLRNMRAHGGDDILWLALSRARLSRLFTFSTLVVIPAFASVSIKLFNLSSTTSWHFLFGFFTMIIGMLVFQELRRLQVAEQET